MMLRDVDNTPGIAQLLWTAPKVWEVIGIYVLVKGIITGREK